MKFLLLVFILSQAAFALEVPKDFEQTDSTFWIHPQTLETVSVGKENLKEGTASIDPMKEISETMDAKKLTLQAMMNITDWKIIDSKEEKKGKDHLMWFFGSYNDSSKQLTHFVEVYRIPAGKNEGPESLLFTRPKKAYTSKEISDRFKVGRQ